MRRTTQIPGLLIVPLSILLASCTICDDPISHSLSNIYYEVYEDDQPFFNTDDLRKSLKITNLKTGTKVDVWFNTIVDRQPLSKFFITDHDFDAEALRDRSCRSYLLSYDVDEVDTLEICMRQKQSKCDGRELMDVTVNWNNKVASYEGFVATIEK